MDKDSKLKPDQIREYIVRSFSLGCAFAALKVYFMVNAEAATMTWYILPFVIAPDFVVAAVVSFAVFFHRKLHLIVADLCLLYYVLNLHYIPFFGDFVTLSTFRFLNEFGQMLDSVAAALDWRLFAGLIILVVGHRLLANVLFRVLRSRRRVNFFGFGGAVVLAALCFAPDLRGYELYLKTPLYTLARSITWSVRSSITGGNSQAPVRAFNDLSKFSGEVPEEVLPEVHPPPHDLNIIIVVLESVGTISSKRRGEITMPNLQELLKNGIRFTNFYSPQPSTVKAHFSLFTGHYPAANLVPITRVRPRIPLPILPDYFHERGYRTAYMEGHFNSYYNFDTFLGGRGVDDLYDAVSLPGAEKYETFSWGIDDRVLFEFSKKWVSLGEPFFLVLASRLAHHPYNIPSDVEPKFSGTEKLDKYHSALFHLDSLIGEIVGHLREKGLFERTVFVFIGDHGEAFGQHKGNFIHSSEVYEENIKVPLLITSPALFKEGHTIDVLGSIPDVFPTVLSLLGIPLGGYGGEGKNLLSPSPGRMVYSSTHLNEDIFALRDGDYKFIFRYQRQKAELYNVLGDPLETNDLSDLLPDRVDYYRDQVLAWAHHTRKAILEE